MPPTTCRICSTTSGSGGPTSSSRPATTPAPSFPASGTSAGTFPTDSGLFVGLTVGVILIIGGLTFFPALALGPLVEHLAMNAGTLFSTPTP